MEFISLHRDALSSGQMGSKLWLCQELEQVSVTRPSSHPPTVWILGGWYGLTAFLLFSRGRWPMARVRSFDIDPHCQEQADLLNENWVWQDWMFKAFTHDANHLAYEEGAWGPAPDWVINTSVEHFSSREWWERIPKGTGVVLQACDMPHSDHIAHFQKPEDLQTLFPVSHVMYLGEKKFTYPDWSFQRFMLIGYK